MPAVMETDCSVLREANQTQVSGTYTKYQFLQGYMGFQECTIRENILGKIIINLTA